MRRRGVLQTTTDDRRQTTTTDAREKNNTAPKLRVGGPDPTCRFAIVAILHFRQFGLTMPIRAPIGVFFEYLTPKRGAMSTKSSKSYLARNHVICRKDRRNQPNGFENMAF